MFNAFTALAFSVRHQPELLKVLDTQMVAEAAKIISVKRNSSAVDDTSYNDTDFAELALAVSSRSKLRKALTPDMVAGVATHLDEDASRPSMRQGESYTYYDESRVQAFAMLAEAVKKDDRLNLAISPEQIAHLTGHLFGLAQKKESENYGNRLEAFESLAGFVHSMNEAPNAWKTAIADKVCDLFKEGSGRESPIVRIVKESAYLMDRARFKDVVDHMHKNHQTDHFLYAFLNNFLDDRTLQSDYPDAVRAYVNLSGRVHGNLNYNYVSTNSIPGYECVVHEELVKAAGQLADRREYKDLSGMFHRWNEDDVIWRLQKNMHERGLHISCASSGRNFDPEMTRLLPARRHIDIIFRKASSDALVCLEGEGYTPHDQSFRDVVGPLEDVTQIEVEAPSDLTRKPHYSFDEANLGIYLSTAPGIRHAFEMVLATPHKSPSWALSIAKKVLSSAPALQT